MNYCRSIEVVDNIENMNHRGGSMPLIGRVPSSKDYQGSDLFSQNESWVTDAVSKISKFFKNLGLLAP